MSNAKSSVLILFLGFCVCSVELYCVDVDALSNVTARVRATKKSSGFTHKDVNFYLLDRYGAIDVLKANVTELCEGMIKNFPKLQVLSLINVNMSRIQPNSFSGVPELRELAFSVNNLSVIENGSFNNIPSLEILYLSGNVIHTIEVEAFQNLKNLRKLHLDRNTLLTLEPAAFTGTPNLQFIDISFNILRTIEKGNFPLLQPSFNEPIELLLAYNVIEDADPKVFDFTNPLILNLRQNQFDAISNLYFGLNAHSSINLDDNYLSCLPDDVLDDIRGSTKSISLKRNPLTCDCMKNIEEALGNGDQLFGIGVLEYSSMIPCSYGQLPTESG
ncbi:unnamed protein product [Phyllotreta striolata]|uniref:Uncharacterized protein n=1 Tax=Phyllotreta striolata TaxID=444603 RepID=A0A9N9XPF1_PHYSR|nr:unnamed protein product [Phyllotreta striolata]